MLIDIGKIIGKGLIKINKSLKKQNMETENLVKPKVDVKAIIAKLNAKTKEVKKPTEKVQATKDDYCFVPGFKKYEWNGIILRNANTKRIMSLKKANKKYQLISNTGKNIDLSIEQINALIPVEKAKVQKKEKVKKENKPKVKSKKEIVLELHKEGLMVKEIIEKSKLNYTTVFGVVNDYQIKTLFDSGKSALEIATELKKKEKFIIKHLERHNFIKSV